MSRGLGFNKPKDVSTSSIGRKSFLEHAQERAVLEVEQGK